MRPERTGQHSLPALWPRSARGLPGQHRHSSRYDASAAGYGAIPRSSAGKRRARAPDAQTTPLTPQYGSEPARILAGCGPRDTCRFPCAEKAKKSLGLDTNAVWVTITSSTYVDRTAKNLVKKERKQTNKRGMGEEDRVHTCTSRILEGRSGAQVGSPAPDKGHDRNLEYLEIGLPRPLFFL